MTSSSFAALGVASDLTDALAERGITEPFPIQALCITDVLDGRDVCGKAKTGSGKTLAFGLPMIERTKPARPRHPRGLVLVPTRELASQVSDELAPLAAARGLSVEAVYGGAPIEKQIRSLHHGVDLVVATPGRLIDLLEREEVSLGDVRTLVLDEADRMSDMGFMPQVMWITRRLPEKRQTLLFSATLDGDVGHLVKHHMNEPIFHEVESKDVTVSTMEHRFLLVHHMDRAKVVASIAEGAEKALVFSRTKRGADRLARDLRELGVKASAIHGDLRQKEREKALAGFAEGRRPVLVATDVAARGIHVEGIDTVVHFDPPEDHKNYLHRSGRTARAGRTGVAVTLVLWDQELDVRRLQKRVGLDEPLVEVFSNDPRLKDLTAWEPRPADDVAAV